MTERAHEIGALNTEFQNPHGLDDEEHYTTAHDLALIAAEALKNETFKKISSTYKYSFKIGDETRTVINHNKLLKMYDGCIGVKTGFTKKSGRCLVSAAEKDGVTLIAVTLNDSDDWVDHKNMLDYAFNILERRLICEEGDFRFALPVIDGDKNIVRISACEDFSVVIDKNAPEIESTVKLSSYFSAPINKGDILGEIIFSSNGDTVGRVYLKSEEQINKRK
jgi:D-alanyl-D-alanine carboxypeptidase/D-alanyl-D-alanine carboxypeptidase (penicillin-binding protein 5/6)